MAYNGIAGCASFIHGSQGCATYIRRYLIGHFREPVDIACSNFSESNTIFGGLDNLTAGLDNVISQYNPKMIGICTTCLAETIGDDVSMFLNEYRKNRPAESLPLLVHASTPSYCGSHTDGFHKAVRATIETLACRTERHEGINVFPPIISPQDLRYLKEIFADFEIDAMILPDYSDSFDGEVWEKYESNIDYGTSIEQIRRSGSARATVEFSCVLDGEQSAGNYLLKTFSTPIYELPLPISIAQTDRLFNLLAKLSGKEIPQKHAAERGRLIDAYIDGHKYLFGKRAVIYGEQDLVISLAAFLNEIGMVPVLCATGEQSGKLADAIKNQIPQITDETAVKENVDFIDIEEAARKVEPDILIGNSNGYKLKRALDVPLVRVGLPIHDRIGAARILHIGYRGAQQLYDRIVNTFIEEQQEKSPVGYTHI
jgi:nitrogenase molybdenum-iron protein NifN